MSLGLDLKPAGRGGGNVNGMFSVVGAAIADLKKLDAAYPSRQRPKNVAMYFIVNIGRKRYFNLGNEDTSDGAPVIGWPIGGRSPAQNEKWKLTQRGDKITLQCLLTLEQHENIGGFAKVLRKITGTKATHGRVDFEWVLEETRDKVYFIKPAGAEELCLTAASNSASTWQEAQLVLASKAATGPARENQEWVFMEVVA